MGSAGGPILTEIPTPTCPNEAAEKDIVKNATNAPSITQRATRLQFINFSSVPTLTYAGRKPSTQMPDHQASTNDGAMYVNTSRRRMLLRWNLSGFYDFWGGWDNTEGRELSRCNMWRVPVRPCK